MIFKRISAISGAVIVAAVTLLAPVRARAQETHAGRPITSVYSLEAGGARNISTYLSPLYYSGLDVALTGSWTKDFQRWSDRCEMRFEASVDFNYTENPVGNSNMPALTARFNWGMGWKYRFGGAWKLTLGPMIDIYGGALYSLRNGNNPVSALAYAGLDAQGSLSWRMKWGKLPVIIIDEVRIPTIGAFFCPGFGESYYEIYIGNHTGLAHFGWWGNAFGIDNLIALRLDLGKTGVQVGYRFDMRNFKANHLQTGMLRNAFVIGIIPNY